MSKSSTTQGTHATPDAGGPEGPGNTEGPIYRQANWCRENSYGYLMKRIVQVMVGEVDKRLESLDLTQAQWAPLMMIHQGRATTLAELSRELQLDPGALTRTLDRLEAKGLCRRERSKEDRRVVHLALTPEGAAAAAPVPEILCEVSNVLLEGFSEAEWQTLMTLLRRLVANADALREGHDARALESRQSTS
jgi:DNA-binding MarR family transcriptional regulator